MPHTLVNIDAGGKRFKVDLATLNRHPNSFFGIMFSDAVLATHGPNEVYSVDCEADLFRHILSYLKYGLNMGLPMDISALSRLCNEAERFRLNGLKLILDEVLDTPVVGDMVRWRTVFIKQFQETVRLLLNTGKSAEASGHLMIGRIITERESGVKKSECIRCNKKSKLATFTSDAQFLGNTLLVTMNTLRMRVIAVEGDCVVLDWNNLHVFNDFVIKVRDR